jgi:flagellar biosynthesis chaperone FliJ
VWVHVFRRNVLKRAGKRAEEYFVLPKLRLDPVVKLEEQKEERRLAEMSDAERLLEAAKQQLAQRQNVARSDTRRSATASDWLLAELSHTRSLSDVRAAEHAVNEATAHSHASRDRYNAAYSRAESLRRVATARREEIVKAKAKVERREQDELGILRFGREAA